MWNHQLLRRIDFRTIPIILGLMIMSLTVISATTNQSGNDAFFTPYTLRQVQLFAIGWVAYIFCAGLNYKKLREWTWILYLIMILILIGLFFTQPINHARRWYRLPLIPFSLQPSEAAKLITVLALSWFLEYKKRDLHRFRTILCAALIPFIPFLLILKQPDLGSALVLFPITLVMFYFGGVSKKAIAIFSTIALLVLGFVVCMFLQIFSHEEMRPIVTKVIKDYQYERLNPNTYHQKAAQTAIALGAIKGSGYRQSEFTGRNWLPYANSDSVFPAFAEEFGLIGAFIMILFFFGLIYFSFQVTAISNDHYGRLLSSGMTVYLAIHIVLNIGMMCGLLPITGVPLILITSGGSSILATMASLGILQSIYTHRYMF